MNIREKIFGLGPKSAEVLLTTIGNGNMEIAVMNYGATLVSVKTPDRAGNLGEITLGFNNLEGYLGKHPYFGVTVGRFANRIAGAKFALEGKIYTLAANNGENHLHGGLRGFDKAMYRHEISETNESLGVRYFYTSPDEEEGYPGNLQVSVTYRLTKSNELVIEYEAETDKPTPVNLTNHTYWNLKAPGKSDIRGHLMTIFADRYLPVDEKLIPTGKLSEVSGTSLDFRTAKAIGRDLDATGGFDHCFIINTAKQDLKPAAIVREPDTGRTLSIFATQPGIQFYSGNFLDGLRGRDNGVFVKHGGFCLETEAFPDAVNQPNFPSAILMPGKYYRETAVHKFGVE